MSPFLSRLLVAYDIRRSHQAARIRQTLRAYQELAQKSVFSAELSSAQQRVLLRDLENLHRDGDRCLILRTDPRAAIVHLGTAPKGFQGRNALSYWG